ncbi:MAG: hypothetical protein NWQ54_02430 [Paraglaciecola sp.]|nr:hypothetical protein [Paraglaciecola sp.]
MSLLSTKYVNAGNLPLAYEYTDKYYNILVQHPDYGDAHRRIKEVYLVPELIRQRYLT